MGYIFLSIALAAGITKAYCGKKTSNYTENITEAILANITRMFFCVCIGFALVVMQGQINVIEPDLALLGITVFSGFFTAVFLVTWLLSVKNGAYMLVEVFLMLGVFIPSVAGFIFFNQTITLKQLLGMCLLVVATFVMSSYNNSQKERLKLRTILLLIVCGVASGFADFSQMMLVKLKPEISISIFNFYIYVFSTIFLVLALLLLSKKRSLNGSAKLSPIFSKFFGYILVMSVCLFANTYFKTKAASYLDSASLYPLNQGCALILSTLMSTVIFKEKLTFKCIIGVAMAFFALLLINVL